MDQSWIGGDRRRIGSVDWKRISEVQVDQKVGLLEHGRWRRLRYRYSKIPLGPWWGRGDWGAGGACVYARPGPLVCVVFALRLALAATQAQRRTTVPPSPQPALCTKGRYCLRGCACVQRVQLHKPSSASRLAACLTAWPWTLGCTCRASPTARSPRGNLTMFNV